MVLDAALQSGLRSGSLALDYLPNERQLRLLDTRQNRIILRFDIDAPFIVLRSATDAVRERLASYKMHETVRENCRLQSLALGSVTQSEIRLLGKLGCTQGMSGVELTLRQENDSVLLIITPTEKKVQSHSV